MNLLEIRARMRNVLDELDVDESHWPDSARLNRFVNEGQDDLSGRLPAPMLPKLWTPDVQNLSINVYLYQLPSNWCRTIEIFVYGVRAPILPIHFEEALTKNALYEPSTTNPYCIEPYYSNYAKIFPTPTSLIIDGFRRHYLRMPVELSNDNDVPELPYNVHQLLVDYAVYRALKEDGDERANDFLAIYMANFGGGQK